MFRTAVLERFSSIIYRGIDSSLVPGVSDIEAAKMLARKLLGKSMAETLNNILEWMERNITYWWERAYIDSIAEVFLYIGLLIIASLISLVMGALLFALFMLLKFPLLVSLVASSVTTIILVLYFIVKMPPSSKLLFVILGSVVLHNFAVEMLKTQPVPVEVFTGFLRLGIIYWIMAGGSLFTLIYLSCIYFRLADRLEDMPKFIAIMRLIDLTFTPGLPVADMLSLRKGICRDYARLTASILANLFLNHRIYFIVIPGHVATGIEINEKIYVLDQKLPVMPLSTWLNYWKRHCPSKVLLLQRHGDGRLIAKPMDKRVCVEAFIPFNLGKELEKLAERTYQAIVNGESTVSHRLSGYARLFEIEDEVVYASLIRKIELVLERELVSHASLIKSIDISRQGDDLLININILAHNEQPTRFTT